MQNKKEMNERMSEYALRTFGLTKNFGYKIAVNQLSINIRRGDIYGFIGPNGSGKTTAMKLVLGLLNPSGGMIELLGTAGNRKMLKRVGSLIESPGLYTDCTAYENMKRFSILCGGSENEISYLLSMVGLAGIGNKKVKSFSLGMKQRLGIAIALLGHPELLVLDEPVNALDPMGMKGVRDMIMDINKQMGVTFFISSHLLGELEKISTVYGIINQGMLVEELTREQLDERCADNLHICCSNPQKALKIILEKFGSNRYEIHDNFLDIWTDVRQAAHINRELVTADILVSEISVTKARYEDYFLSRMGNMNVGGGVGQYV